MYVYILFAGTGIYGNVVVYLRYTMYPLSLSYSSRYTSDDDDYRGNRLEIKKKKKTCKFDDGTTNMKSERAACIHIGDECVLITGRDGDVE